MKIYYEEHYKMPLSRKRLRLFSAAAMLPVLALALISTSCVNLRQKPSEKRYFVIDTTRPGAAAALPGSSERILSVRRFRVSPHYEGKGLVYRESEVGYQSDFYNEYFISTHAMFTEETRQWLAASGLFAHVVDTSSRLDATYALEGSVTALHGDFTDSKNPRAVLELQFLLIDDSGVDPSILLSKTYKIEIPLERRSPEELIAGFAKALAQSLTEFESDLRETLR